MSYPLMVLKRLLTKETAADHGVKTAKDTLLEAVTKRFADIEEEPLYSLATVIDPRLGLTRAETTVLVLIQP
ncbi:hypothetical protein AMECASPLE_017332 [Ameca splendens]|uniref:Uncharacterized protein n=1 Tax=Ameca splendens TaxID=208324 RepID=A0ABV0ZB71_9TELE